MKQSHAFRLLFVFPLLFSSSMATAQVDPVTIIDPMPWATAILGSAQMDGDPAEKLPSSAVRNG